MAKKDSVSVSSGHCPLSPKLYCRQSCDLRSIEGVGLAVFSKSPARTDDFIQSLSEAMLLLNWVISSSVNFLSKASRNFENHLKTDRILIEFAANEILFDKFNRETSRRS